MLKQWALLLLSLTALNCEIWNEPARKFTAGKEYLYHYDAQILTGIPTSSWHYTGYRLLAQVRLLVKDKEKIQMRLEEIRFLRMNQEITIDEPTVFLPRELFEQMTEETVARRIERELQRPIQFLWKQGVVSALETDVKEQFWSVNMKKGLLNMLNMDLTPHDQEDRLKWYGNFIQSSYEDGIEGRCRSAYHWNRLPIRIMAEEKDQQKQENVAITMVKTRDLKDCLETPVFEHALFLTKDCDERRMNVSRDLVKAEATTRANVTYWQNKKDFFTWHVNAEARYTFAPVNAKLGSISSFVKQNLTFVEERPIREEESKKKEEEEEEKVEMRQEKSLQMIVPIPEIMPKKNATEELTKVIFDLLSVIRNQMKERSPKLMTLVKEWILVLRQAPKELLLKVHKECAKRAAEEVELFDLFHDILPSVATKEAVELFVEIAVLSTDTKVDNDLAVAGRVRRFGLMNHVVYKEIIFAFINAAKSPIVQKKTHRRETLKAIIITVSSLTKTYMDQRKRPELEFTPDFEEEVPKRVFDFLNQLLETEVPCLKEQERIIVVCRALGNVALPKGLQLLTRLIYTDKLPVAIRVQCVYALRLYAPEKPEIIRQWVLPMFFDVTKDAELRIASYLIAMRTRPNRVVLDSIVESIRREPVEQVQTFVMSHLKNVAEAPCHCDCMVVRNISRSIETLRMKNAGLQYSQVHHFPLSESERVVLRTDTIFTPEEFVPRSANVRILKQGNGRETDLLEMGLRTEGLQNVLEKLVGPNGKLFSVTKLQEFMKVFEPTETLSEINLSFYVKLFGEELNFWTLNGQIKNLVQEGFNFVPKNFMPFLSAKESLPLNFHRTMFTDVTIRLPTIFGLPFTANFTNIIHLRTVGEMAMKRSVFDKEMVHAVVRVTPTIFTQHLLEAGIDATVTKAFTQIKVDAHVPELKNISVNVMYMKTGKTGFRVHVEKPKVEWRLVEINSTMNSVFAEMKQSLGYAIQKVPMPIKFDIDTQEDQQPMEFNTPITPFGLTVSGYMKLRQQRMNRYPILWPMRGHFQFTAVLRNTENRPEAIEFRVVRDDVKKTLKLQILRAKPMTAINRNIDREDMETDIPDDSIETRPLNTKLIQKEKVKETKKTNEMLVAEIAFTGKSIKKTQFHFNITIKMGKLFSRQEEASGTYVLQGMVIFPKRQMEMNRENPLLVAADPRGENLFAITCRLIDGEEQEMLKYKMTFDRDEFAVRFFERVSGNVRRYRAMHPMLSQCYEDLQQRFTNSPACHFAQRYLNLFNRQNHTLVVSAEAPMVLKRIVSFIVTKKMTFLTQFMGEITSIDSEQTLEFIENDEFFSGEIDVAGKNPSVTPKTRKNRRFENDGTRRNPMANQQKSHKSRIENEDETSSTNTLENENTRKNNKHSRKSQLDDDETDLTSLVKASKTQRRMEADDDNDDVSQNTDVENKDQIYHVSLIAEPFDLRVLSVNYLFDTISMRFDRLIMPTTWFSHMHATDRFYAIVMGALTQERYPAVCRVRTTPDRAAVHVMTFDALLFNSKSVFPSKEKRVILAQDLYNRFQVSVAASGETKELTIVTRDFSQRIQLICTPRSDTMRIIVDGEEQRELPFIVRNNKKQIILSIEAASETTGNTRGSQIVRVELPLLGVRITSDVFTLFDLEVSIFYHNMMRGICGDFDGERRQEMKTRDCQKFFLQPNEVFIGEEYVVNRAAPAVEQQPEWLTLKRCQRETRLMPFTMRRSVAEEVATEN